MPEISVIMPVYNTEETFLRHAIESILVQSFADFELIVVNDGANAQTTLVIDKYATEDKRIKVIHNPVNKGVSFARNIGKIRLWANLLCLLTQMMFVIRNSCKFFIKLWSIIKPISPVVVLKILLRIMNLKIKMRDILKLKFLLILWTHL